jgi:hypothetical protein
MAQMGNARIWRTALVLSLGLGTLALTQLGSATQGSASAPDAEPMQGTGGCTSNTWCRTFARRDCADNNATICVGGECIYVLKISQTPPNMCIAGDVRVCDLSPTTEGIQTCEALGGSGGGCNWGPCESLCSP